MLGGIKTPSEFRKDFLISLHRVDFAVSVGVGLSHFEVIAERGARSPKVFVFTTFNFESRAPLLRKHLQNSPKLHLIGDQIVFEQARTGIGFGVDSGSVKTEHTPFAGLQLDGVA